MPYSLRGRGKRVRNSFSDTSISLLGGPAAGAETEIIHAAVEDLWMEKVGIY